MAKLSVTLRNEKREHIVARDAEKRAKLKAIISSETASYDEKIEARDALNKLPRNGSEIRVRSRCMLTGRPRGNYRKFKLCRNMFRELASRGGLPGVTKSSW